MPPVEEQVNGKSELHQHREGPLLCSYHRDCQLPWAWFFPCSPVHLSYKKKESSAQCMNMCTPIPVLSGSHGHLCL